jgi:predicted aspartyl protease
MRRAVYGRDARGYRDRALSFPFEAHHGLVIVRAELFGPSGSIVLRLALDTGATGTMVNVGPPVAVGYDPSLMPDRVQVTTGSGVEFIPRIAASRLRALGREYADFQILGHTLPPSASVDGLLGLDFFRGRALNIDFREGRITLH